MSARDDARAVRASQGLITGAEVSLETRLKITADLELLEDLLRLHLCDGMSASAHVERWRTKRGKIEDVLAARRARSS